MTGAEFTADVLTFLDVDGARRGIEAFRTSYIKAAIADLAAYIDEYNTGQTTYGSLEQTPFDSETAEAVAEFLKSKITRNIDRDLGLSQQHTAAYLNIRRRIFLRLREARNPELRPWIGKKFVTTLTLRTANRIPVGLYGNVWLTVKMYRGQPDTCAVFQLVRGDGIEVLDAPGGRIRATFTEAQTALLCTGIEYVWDVQAETEDHDPILPLNGLVLPRMPVTQAFTEAIMAVDTTPPEDNPLTSIDGKIISLIE